MAKMAEKEKKEVPIYEKIGPDECLIISRDEKGILIACNKGGEIDIKRVSYPKEEE